MTEKNKIREALSRISWLFYGIMAAILVFLGILFYQGEFKGFFIKTYLPTKYELKSLTVQRGDTKFAFDYIGFYYFDLVSGESRAYEVSFNQYLQILDRLQGSSKVEFTQSLLSQFEGENLAKLIIYIIPKGQTDRAFSIPYQRVEIIENSGYFRIQRVDKEGPYIWDYYQSPGVFLDIKKIFL